MENFYSSELKYSEFLYDIFASNKSSTGQQLILTANQRQGRFLRQKCSLNTVASNNTELFTFFSWIKNCYLDCQDHAVPGFERRLISPFEEQALWRQVAEEITSNKPLVNTEQLQKMLKQTADNVLLFQVPLAQLEQSRSEEAALFIQCYKQFVAKLDEHELEAPLPSMSRLIQHFEKFPPNINAIYLYGFAEVPPLFNRLCGQATNALALVRGDEPAEKLNCIQFNSIDEEIESAAHWVKQTLTQDPNQQIAVVVPQLTQLRSIIERQFLKVLEPKRYLNASSCVIPSLFDISAGQSLSATACIRCAIDLLIIGQRHTDRDRMLSITQSIYWGAAYNPARQSLAEWLACRSEKKISSTTFLSWLKHFEGETKKKDLAEAFVYDSSRIISLQQQRAWSKKNQTISAWIDWYIDILETLGWPGPQTLSSYDYQCVQVFMEALNTLRCTEPSLVQLNKPSDFHAFLHSWCNSQVFHPEIKIPKVRILGLMEASGLKFDQCRIIGLTEAELPSAPSPDPLLPIALQQKYNTPKSSVEREYHYSKALLNDVVGCARHVTFSYASGGGENEQQNLSPLVEHYLGPADKIVQQSPDKNDELLRVNLAEKPYSLTKVDTGTAPTIPKGSNIRGGAYHLDLYHLNPLYAFFKYRLLVDNRDIPPIAGLDARLRGNLLHDCLALLYKKYDTQTKIKTLTDASDIEAELAPLVNRSMQALLEQITSMPIEIEEYEKNRLIRSLLSVIKTDAARNPPWKILELEAKKNLVFKDRTLRFRIDRVDTAKGLVIVDYKTGASSINPLLKKELAAYQLPLYTTVYAREDIAAVCYLQVEEKDVAYNGIGTENTFRGIMSPDKVRGSEISESFHDLIIHWRSSIESTIANIIEGKAVYRASDVTRNHYFSHYLLAVRQEELERNDV